MANGRMWLICKKCRPDDEFIHPNHKAFIMIAKYWPTSWASYISDDNRFEEWMNNHIHDESDTYNANYSDHFIMEIAG